ncbi:MAG: hypothetical protein ACI4MJ_11895 [Aristaeellaceae bacterium]
MERILLLMTAPCYADACECLCSASENAAHPARLTYGLSLMETPEEEDLIAMNMLGMVQYLCPGGDVWQEVERLWQGEGYILMANPAMYFDRGWDEELLRILRQCGKAGENRAVLTGYLPRRMDPVDAVYPVAAEGFDEQGRLCFHRGVALRYARAPQKSAFLHRDFCFGPAGFFRDMARESDSPLFMRAFRGNWELYTLHRPVIRASWDVALPPEKVDPVAEEITGGRSRFEKQFGMRLETQQLSAMARQGVFTTDMHFPVRIPVRVRVREAVRDARLRRSKLTPLCVTAFLSLPHPTESLREEQMGWFSRLSRLKNLSLLCYADGAICRQLVASHPNVLEYKPRYGLQVGENLPPEAMLNYVRLCKPFLLARSREKMLGHSHYIWLDFGYLRYPVYERAALDWSALCSDKVTLAVVNGQLDTSMLVLPQEQVLPLCREITALCQSAWKSKGELPEEHQVWQELAQRHPGQFQLVELPARRELLTLALTDRDEESAPRTRRHLRAKEKTGKDE